MLLDINPECIWFVYCQEVNPNVSHLFGLKAAVIHCAKKGITPIAGRSNSHILFDSVNEPEHSFFFLTP